MPHSLGVSHLAKMYSENVESKTSCFSGAATVNVLFSGATSLHNLKVSLHKFCLVSQLQNLYEQIFDTTFDKRNFRKKVARMKYVIPLNEKQIGVRHKPAQLYVFSREVFQKTRKELFDFIKKHILPKVSGNY